MVLVRLPDWDLRLVAHLRAVADRPFAYGTADCFCFVSGAVRAMTGTSLFPAFEGAYNNRFGMLRALRRQGYRSLRDAARDRAGTLNWSECEPVEATPGDIVLLPGSPLTSLGVCWHDGALAQGRTAVVLVGAEHIIAAWKIPHAAVSMEKRVCGLV
jgi:hypothetical protein